MKTNIIELKNLREKPCEEWLARFDFYGRIDAHEAFIKYVQEYQFLYKYSDYDLIGWQIENGVFDWNMYSWVIPPYCPQHFDAEKYNWAEDSEFVDMYLPQFSHLNPLRK